MAIEYGGHWFRLDLSNPFLEKGRLDPGTELLLREVPEMAASPQSLPSSSGADREQGRVRTLVDYSGGHGVAGVLLGAHFQRVLSITDNYLTAQAVSTLARRNGMPHCEPVLLPLLPGVPGDRWDGLSPSATVVTANLRFIKGKERFPILLAQAADFLTPEGALLVVGHKTHSIKPFEKLAGDYFARVSKIRSKSGHTLLCCEKPPGPPRIVPTRPTGDSDARPTELTVQDPHDGTTLRFRAAPGVFAAGRLDEGTTLLLEEMEVGDASTICDLGCGAGPLGIAAAHRAPRSRVIMVDINQTAVYSAGVNCRLNEITNAVCGVTDGLAGFPAGSFDTILCNPPFHLEHLADTETAQRLIAESYRALRSGGSLQLVANRFLPYEQQFLKVFGNYHIKTQGPRFKVLIGVKE